MPPLGPEGWREIVARGASGRGRRPAYAFVTLRARPIGRTDDSPRPPRPDARGACAARSWRWAISTASISATRRWSARRSTGRAPRAARRSSRPSIRTRCAISRRTMPAVPADHARPARRSCSPRPGPTRCWCSTSTTRWRRCTARGLRRPSCSARHIGAAGVVTGEDFTFGKGRGGNLALLATRARGTASRRAPSAPVHDEAGAGLLQPHPRRAQGRRLRDRDAADDPAVRDPRHGPARRQARARRSAIPPPTSTSAPTCARATASTR